MKKIIKGLLITLGVLIGLVLILFIALSIAIHDTTDQTPVEIKNNQLSADQVFQREMVEALSYDEDIVLSFDAYTLNELVYGVVKDLSLSSITMKGVYVKTSGNEYQVELPCKVYGISTVVKVKVSIQVEKADGITIVLKDISCGSFKADSVFVRKVILGTGTMKKLESQLKEKGIEAEIKEDYSLSMSRDQIITTIGNLCDTETRGLFKILAKLALSEDFFEINTSSGAIVAKITTKDLLYDKSRDGAIMYPLSLNTVVEKTKEKMSSLSSKELPAVFSYYTIGYDSLSDEKKEVINHLGLSKYESGIKNEKKTIINVLSDSGKNLSLADFVINRGVTINVTDKQLNSVLSSLSFIGAGTAFGYEGSLAYIVVESLELTMNKNALGVRLLLNMNGKRIVITADASALPVDSLCLNAEITELHLGSYTLDSSYTKEVLAYLNDQMTELGWIYTTDTAFVIDLEKTIEEHILLSAFLSAAEGRRIEVEDSSLEIILSK